MAESNSNCRYTDLLIYLTDNMIEPLNAKLVSNVILNLISSGQLFLINRSCIP